jgi:uncharacterized membrane protein YkoI
MRLFTTLLAAAFAVGLTAAPAAAADFGQQSRDAERAFRATVEGRSMPLPKIEQRVMPFMGGADYLGPELKGENYRLKFMKNGRVIWVDVDAATGRIKKRSR